MTTPVVPVVCVPAALADVAASVFPGARVTVLARDELRPARPFAGRLFAILEALPVGACVGLVVPMRLVATAASCEPHIGHSGPPAAGSEPSANGHGLLAKGFCPPGGGYGAPGAADRALIAVEDHVDLELRGPLTGPWPAGVPRSFPAMSGRYQPAVVRSVAGPRVYSGGVVAGVGDLGRLTPFEGAASRRAGCLAVADLLVPPAVVAAYYGHTLAACGVVQGPPVDEE